MELAGIALGLGLVLAVVSGGSLARLLDTRLRHLWLLVAAVAVQLLLGLWHPGRGWPPGLAVALYVGSFGAVILFGLVNLRLTGMAVVVLGVTLNALVTLVNGGMPVRLPSGAGPEAHRALERSATHHAERPDDDLRALGQIVPLPGLDRSVSFGDLILSAGVVDVVFRASRRRRRRLTVAPAPAPGARNEDSSEANEPAALGHHDLEDGYDLRVVGAGGS